MMSMNVKWKMENEWVCDLRRSFLGCLYFCVIASVWFMALNGIDVYKLAPHFVKTIKWWSGIMVSEFRIKKQRQRKRKSKSWLTAHWICFEYKGRYYSSNIQLIYFVCLSSGIGLINMYNMRSTGKRNKRIQIEIWEDT